MFNHHTEVVQLLLDTIKTRPRESRELDPRLLYTAVEDDCVEIAKMLIKFGADVNDISLRELPLMRSQSPQMVISYSANLLDIFSTAFHEMSPV